MFKWKRTQVNPQSIFSTSPVASFGLEGLEDRRLLSASHHVSHASTSSANSGGGYGHGRVQNTITANLLPGGSTGAIAAELDTLSGTTLTDTSTVYLGNSHGIETYSIRVTATGTKAVYTVDVNGNPVTAPTQSTTTFGALSGTVSSEFSAIATDLGLTDPVSTATVNVVTPVTGDAVYSLRISGSTGKGGRFISVDASGNPVGNENVPFEALSTTLQDALNALAPTGATPLTSTSTQNVHVETVDGVTLYSVKFTAAGVTTTVTVNEAGKATSLPTKTDTTFGALTTTVKTELQTLATADGFTGTIADTAAVVEYTEANGTIIFAITLPVTKTSSSGSTFTANITVASDSLGNPTVPPHGGGGGCGGGHDDGGLFGDRNGGSLFGHGHGH